MATTVTEYTTNGSGVAVAGTPVVETFVYDEGAQSRGDVILDFVDSDGSGGNSAAVSKRYLWGQAVDQLFAQEDVAGKAFADSDRYLWLLQDKLGTVRDVLDRSGGIVARVEYNAFGVIQSVTNAAGQTIALPTRWLYTCQEYDPITGNIWFSNGAGRGRWYSPTLNRFLQPDDLGFAAGDMNLYRPVGNSPTNYTDPSGQRKSWGYWFQNHWDNWGKWVAFPGVSIGIAIGTSHDPVEAAKEVAQGFKTGTKAVVNGVAIAAVKTVTLGTCGDGLELIGVTDKDRELGYDTAVQFSTASGEILIGVASGNAAAILKNGGTLARAASGALNILDAAGNIVGVVKGVYDAKTNGINLSNGLQIAGSLLGLAGNAKGLAKGCPDAPKRVPTGQIHHPISTKIARELESHPTLRGNYTPRDPRFTTQAIDADAHKGYQTWHRNLDDEVVDWLRRPENRSATPEQFEAWMRWRYGQPDLADRFPNGFNGAVES